MARLVLLLIVALAAGALLVESIPARPAQAAFPGANGKIVVVRWTSIVVMNSDGSDQVTLETPIDGWIENRDPAWSPDGRQIVFDAHSQDGHDIYVMNADGSHLTRLTHSGRIKAGPTWSPDGARIAFAMARGGNYDIFAMNSDGSDVHQLTTRNGYAPSWSADGTKIAFSTTRLEGQGIYTIDAGGQNETRLTDDPTDKEPAWAPDMRHIVFVRRVLTRVQPEGFPEPQIHVMNSDGSGIIALTTHDSSNARRESPEWSPDGKQIVYVDGSRGSENHEIYVMNPDGSNQHNISNHPSDYSPPSWQSVLTKSPNKGDSNCDSTVNTIDAALVLQSIAGLLHQPLCHEASDVDHNDEVDSVDVLLILQYSAGLLDHL